MKMICTQVKNFRGGWDNLSVEKCKVITVLEDQYLFLYLILRSWCIFILLEHEVDLLLGRNMSHY